MLIGCETRLPPSGCAPRSRKRRGTYASRPPIFIRRVALMRALSQAEDKRIWRSARSASWAAGSWATGSPRSARRRAGKSWFGRAIRASSTRAWARSRSSSDGRSRRARWSSPRPTRCAAASRRPSTTRTSPIRIWSSRRSPRISIASSRCGASWTHPRRTTPTWPRTPPRSPSRRRPTPPSGPSG